MSTPKTFYPVIGGIDLSSCRLCNSAGDAMHCKNLFKAANADILADVERLTEDVLPRDKELPQLVCRPCERKVKNFASLQNIVKETQQKLNDKRTRAKRCIELSPSAPLPQEKITSG